MRIIIILNVGGRLLKQRLLRYKWSSTAKSESKILVNRAFYRHIIRYPRTPHITLSTTGSTPVVLAFRPWRLRLLEAHSMVQFSPIKEAAAHTGLAPAATAQAGTASKGAAAQAGAAPVATAQAGAPADGP